MWFLLSSSNSESLALLLTMVQYSSSIIIFSLYSQIMIFCFFENGLFDIVLFLFPSPLLFGCVRICFILIYI